MTQPNALLATQLGDLVATSLRELGRAKWTDISSSIQKHTALRNLIKKHKITIDSGVGLQWDVMVGQTGAAQNVGLAATDNVNITDVMTQAQADWRNSTTNWAIIGQEVQMNSTPARIVNLVETRRLGSMISLAELMEDNFWGPPVASTDNLTPWGINTWVVKNATEGFNGGAPSGYTSIGLNPTTYPNWKNYTAQYTAVSRDDLIRKMRRAATFTGWEPTVDGIPDFDTGDAVGIYTNYGVIGPLEEALESQNDNLGSDVASQDGKCMFRRQPVNWVPKLEADTTNPVYGIDWGVFTTFVLQGWWLKETRIEHYPGQHTLAVNFLDCTYNWVMRNRRTSWVIATGVTYPS